MHNLRSLLLTRYDYENERKRKVADEREALLNGILAKGSVRI